MSAEAQKESPDKRVWRNAAGLLGGNAVGEVLNGGAQALMIVILGPAAFGRLSQALAVAEVADGVAAFGLNQVGPVMAVHHRQRLGEYLGTVLGVRSIVTLLVMIAVVLLAPLLKSTAATTVYLASALLLFSPLSMTATIPFFLKQENWRVMWVPGVSALVNVGLLALVLVFAPSVVGVLGALLGGKAVTAIIYSELARRRYQFRYRFSWDVARQLLRIGPKAAWMDAVVITYMKASYFVLDGLGPAVLGVYAAAERIATPFLRVTGMVSASSLTMFSELAREKGGAEVRGFYARTVSRVMVALLGIGVLIYAAVPAIIRAYFPDYEGSIPILMVLYVGVCFMAVNQITSSCLNGLGHFGKVAVVATINLGVYAIGVWLWVGDHGALGAAYATTLMEGCNMMMQLALLLFVLSGHRGAA